MNKPFSPMQREKLLVALQAQDILDGLNLALKVRKMAFTLDYTGVTPKLYIGAEGSEPEGIMTADPRRHICYISWPQDIDLRACINHIHEHLAKFESRLSLTAHNPKNGKRECLLQVYVGGADNIAITLLNVKRGSKKTDSFFELPGKK